MNLCNQIKKYRNERGFSQKDLAEKIYVSTQTISNWENERSYPDIQNLLLLSVLFDVTLDDLVKGDVDEMKRKIETNEMNKLLYVMVGSSLLMSLSIGVVWAIFDVIRWWSMLLPLFFWIIGMYAALKIEKMKKDKNIKTYREICAYINGNNVEEQRAKRDRNKDRLQKAIIVILVSIISGIITLLAIFIAMKLTN